MLAAVDQFLLKAIKVLVLGLNAVLEFNYLKSFELCYIFVLHEWCIPILHFYLNLRYVESSPYLVCQQMGSSKMCGDCREIPQSQPLERFRNLLRPIVCLCQITSSILVLFRKNTHAV